MTIANPDKTVIAYMKAIGKVKPITQAEEFELARRIRAGDDKALQKLVCANLRFVISVCRHYRNRGLPFGDLINEGNLGLIRAARHYDESKGFKFISYAVWWIRQALMQSIAEKSRIVKLPTHKFCEYNKIHRINIQLEQKLGRAPTMGELSQWMGIGEETLDDHFLLSFSLQAAQTARDEDENPIMDLKDENTVSPDDSIHAREMQREIGDALGKLTPKESQVVKLYYGIDCETPHSLADIAHRISMTREGVRQIKEKALRKLQHAKRSRPLLEFA